MSRHYPDAPRIGVSVLCVRDDFVLMIKRGKSPYENHWSLPGGLVELGESLRDAAERELLEETGVKAGLGVPVETFDSIQRDDAGLVSSHYVLTVFSGPYLTGEVTAGDDAADARWMLPSDIDNLQTTPGTPERIRRLLQA
jgi:8-oxo-dGTP diphosphatase